jgi:hypothetical protein
MENGVTVTGTIRRIVLRRTATETASSLTEVWVKIPGQWAWVRLWADNGGLVTGLRPHQRWICRNDLTFICERPRSHTGLSADSKVIRSAGARGEEI